MPKERQTCTACSMRRQKCDRQEPCSRCVKRGEADKCTREWGPEGYDPSRHRVYPRPNTKVQDSPTSQHSNHPLSDNTSHSQDSLLPDEVCRHSISRSHVVASVNGAGQRQQSTTTQPLNGTHKDAEKNQDSSAGGQNTKVLEFLTWGKTPLAGFQIGPIDLAKDTCKDAHKNPTTDWNYSNGFGGTGSAQISFLQLLLPNRKQIIHLAEYHLNSVTWYHGAVHSPTFLAELHENYNESTGLQVRDLDLRWAALLFGIMASSMTCAPESLTSSWGFHKSERAKLTRQWFKATLSCLNLADYMWRHHIYSVQAIATLTMSAHILGFSNTQSTLMGAALKIAQGLGLQRLGPEEEVAAGTSSHVEKLIRRETGRRLWYQLCVQDWFSIPFSEMYCIQKHHFTTIIPQTLNEDDMSPVPPNIPSITSFGNNLQELARLMADSHDAVVKSSTLFTKYDEVIQYEGKIRKWLADLPTCLRMGERIDPAWPRWVPWARRALLSCFSHKIIMIHRNFLGRSFAESAFAHTREACMTAAKVILREAKSAAEDDSPTLWIDQAFMVAAGITLSLDIFHRNVTEPEYAEHTKLVENNISLLSKFEDSMIAARGTRLLSSLLTEQARSAATQSLDNYRNKRTRDGDSWPTSATSIFGGGLFQSQPKRPRQKFDMPRFVESLGGNESFTESLRKNNGDAQQPQQPLSTFAAPQLFGSSPATTTVVPTTKLNGTTSYPTNQPYTDLPNRPTSPTFSSSLGLGPSIATASYHPSMPPSSAASHLPTLPPSTTTASTNYTITTVPLPTSTTAHPTTVTATTLPIDTSTLEQFQIPGSMDFGYETFEQLFPPQTGMSNSYLFEDLLNFDF